MDWYNTINMRITQLIPQILRYYDYSDLIGTLSKGAQGEFLRCVLDTNCVVIADLVVTLMFGERVGNSVSGIDCPGVYRLDLGSYAPRETPGA